MCYIEYFMYPLYEFGRFFSMLGPCAGGSGHRPKPRSYSASDPHAKGPHEYIKCVHRMGEEHLMIP